MTHTLWWTLTLLLMLAGLVGTVAPLLPGTTVILAAAIMHHLALGEAQRLSRSRAGMSGDAFSDGWGARKSSRPPFLRGGCAGTRVQS